MQVFLSHGHTDAKLASRLASELEERGLDVWWDQKIQSGERWDEALRRALREADACVVLVSRASDPAEPRLSKEWSAVQQRSWDEPGFRIVPVQLRDAVVPPFLRKWQGLRLAEPAKEINAAADKIVASLRQAEPPRADVDEAQERAALAARFAEVERMVAKLDESDDNARHHLKDG
jgi:hypothetical protein